MKSALVVPSNRPANLRAFLAAWEPFGDWDHVIVVEDCPERSDSFGEGITHVSWREIDDDLGGDAWIISRCDSAIRSYGFLLAARAGADLICTLDDDCSPLGPGYVSRHIAAMSSHSRWCQPLEFPTRGIPYVNRGSMSSVLNVGLWSHVPDLDAPRQLTGPITDFSPPPGTRLVPSGQYFPCCGMNLAFTRGILPLMYFPLMGANSPYRRFDDIWAGIVAKKVLDHLRLAVSIGEPHVRHDRASDPFVNLVKEAPGIAFNERFWTLIDSIALAGSDPASCVLEIAESLIRSPEEYPCQLGKSLAAWASLCPPIA